MAISPTTLQTVSRVAMMGAQKAEIELKRAQTTLDDARNRQQSAEQDHADREGRMLGAEGGVRAGLLGVVDTARGRMRAQQRVDSARTHTASRVVQVRQRQAASANERADQAETLRDQVTTATLARQIRTEQDALAEAARQVRVTAKAVMAHREQSTFEGGL